MTEATVEIEVPERVKEHFDMSRPRDDLDDGEFLTALLRSWDGHRGGKP